MKFIAIIPARYASTRFPGKPLVDMRGKTMIQRVYEQVSSCLSSVYVATDDDRIYRAVEAFGGRAVMTSAEHRSGTDRCREAYERIGGGEDVVINIQGDEPFIQPRQIEDIMACFDDADTQIATLVKPFTEADGEAALFNPNSPKVVLNSRNEAMYFSRSVIPYLRGCDASQWLSHHTFYKHIGMYAYRPTSWPRSPVCPVVARKGRVARTVALAAKRLSHQSGYHHTGDHRHRYARRPRTGLAFS